MIIPADAYFDGHQLIGVRPRVGYPDDGPPFTYSIDLSIVKPGWPELIAIGFDAGRMINALAGAPEPPLGLVHMEGAPVPFLVRLVNAAHAREHYTFQIVDPAAPLAQIIVPDKDGRFPWDEGCAAPYKDQTLLPVGTVTS